MQWQLQEARNRLSYVVKKATDEGAQIISVRGVPTAIILSVEEYNRLTQPKTRLTDFLKESPTVRVTVGSGSIVLTKTDAKKLHGVLPLP